MNKPNCFINRDAVTTPMFVVGLMRKVTLVCTQLSCLTTHFNTCLLWTFSIDFQIFAQYDKDSQYSQIFSSDHFLSNIGSLSYRKCKDSRVTKGAPQTQIVCKDKQCLFQCVGHLLYKMATRKGVNRGIKKLS